MRRLFNLARLATGSGATLALLGYYVVGGHVLTILAFLPKGRTSDRNAKNELSLVDTSRVLDLLTR